MERRSSFIAPFASLEVRASGTGSDHYIIEGHAAVYGQRSVNLGGFTEVIAPAAFRSVLASRPDVHLLWHHDSTKVLARSRSISGGKPGLTLREDGAGLHVWARVTPTTYSADLRRLLEDGLVDNMSFAFSTAEDGSGEKWERDSDGAVTRTVTSVQGLYDVTITARGAYPQTDVALGRSLFESARSAGLIVGWQPGDVIPPVPNLAEAARTRDFEQRRASKVARMRRVVALAEASANA